MRLAEGFEPATRAQWMAQVERVLARGRGELDPQELDRLFRQILVTPTYNGFDLQPLYTAEDVPDVGRDLPGHAPFVRGAQAAPRPNGWDVRQIVAVSGDGSSSAGLALEELENGAVSVMLDLRAAERIDRDLLDRVLQGVYLDATTTAIEAGARAPQAFAALAQLWEERAIDVGSAAVTVGCDPLGEAARTADWGAVEGALAAGVALAQRLAPAGPRQRALAVDATIYLDGGGSEAQHLGCAVATGVSYLRALVDAGMPIDAALSQIEFRLAATADQFSTIAAMRAMRRLWARVAEACGAGAGHGAAHIHAITSRAMVSQYDPWVNLLRTTVACFAAGVGGAQAVSVLPYDAASAGDSAALGRRIARNTQTLLTDESALGAVVDPAGGSWFVERLTEQLAQAAWEWFQRIERAGGMFQALRSGMVAEHIATTWEQRLVNLAHRRDPVTGISEFPNIDEPPPAATPGVVPPPAGAIPLRRYAEPFEAQRRRVDALVAEGGERPRVFLANLGSPAIHTARATFAKNLFEIAGIRAVMTDGFDDDDDLIAAHRADGAALVCICSSDALYAERAAAVAERLRHAGAARIYLAGRPGEREEALLRAGVDEFIYVGCDVLETIGRALDAVGVQR